MVTTSVSPFLPASANTIRTSAVFPALHAALNASSKQASRRKASTCIRHDSLCCWQRVQHVYSKMETARQSVMKYLQQCVSISMTLQRSSVDVSSACRILHLIQVCLSAISWSRRLATYSLSIASGSLPMLLTVLA